MSTGKVGDDWGKMYAHVPPPPSAPSGGSASANAGKDPQYTNPEPGQSFPRGQAGVTVEGGKSFGIGQGADVKPGFSGSGPAG